MQKRNTQPRIYYAIRFLKCGAENHPAYSEAIRFKHENGLYMYQLNFPIHVKGILKSKQSQRLWASEKRKHLNTWASAAAIIIELAQLEKEIR